MSITKFLVIIFSVIKKLIRSTSIFGYILSLDSSNMNHGLRSSKQL